MRSIGHQREGLPQQTELIPGPLVQRQVRGGWTLVACWALGCSLVGGLVLLVAGWLAIHACLAGLSMRCDCGGGGCATAWVLP